ncbi:MAG: hypothetical protein RLZ55_1107 [Actinomycetota bacterium]|jgi:predicted O-linked N-acetylglucosamine transferase (SPINDLY family)
MPDENPLLSTLADMTAASVARANLNDEVLLLVRLAALVASDAPEASYLVNLGAALDTELDLEDAQSVLIAVAPIVGTAKVIKAAGRLADALDLGLAIVEEAAFEDAVEAEAEAEAEAGL